MIVFTGKLTYGMAVEEMREFIDSTLNASDQESEAEEGE